ATAAATQARAAITPGSNILEVGQRFGGVQGIATEVTRNGYLGGLGNEGKIVGGLFATPAETWSKPLVGTWSVVLGFVLEHAKPSEEEYQKLAPQIRNDLLNERRQTRFTEWLQAVRSKAKIEDFRDNFFEA